MSGGALLRAWTARVAEGTPQALEDHSELRWLEPGRWYDVAWLPADLRLVTALDQELGSMRDSLSS